MEAQSDFKDLLELLNAHQVEFLIVGGYAMAFHGVPRSTGDLDLLIKPDAANAERLIIALTEFGFGSLGLAAEDFQVPDVVVQLGYPPVRIDLITSITGVSWEEAEASKVEGMYGEVSTFFIGREQLIKNKQAVGRLRDLADIEALCESEEG